MISLRLARPLHCIFPTRQPVGPFPRPATHTPYPFPPTHPRGPATPPGRWPLLFSSSPRAMPAASKTCRLSSPKILSGHPDTRDPHQWTPRSSPPKHAPSAAAPTTPSAAGRRSAQTRTSRGRRKRNTDARSALTNGRSGRDSCRAKPPRPALPSRRISSCIRRDWFSGGRLSASIALGDHMPTSSPACSARVDCHSGSRTRWRGFCRPV
jgi:hypothetical protein